MTRDAQDDHQRTLRVPIYPIAELIPSGRLLYYPCSGQDTRFPLECFAESIDSFWFADLRYVKDLRPSIAEFEIPCPCGYEVETRTKIKVDPGIRDPFAALRCQLRDTQSGRRIEVLYLASDAVGVFQSFELLQKRVSVLCHRRDGIGEGGSNLWWLHPEPAPEGAPGFLDRILSILEPGGKIISDGSNALPGFSINHGFDPSGHHQPEQIHYNRWQVQPEGLVDPECQRTVLWTTKLIH
jgi:hypothetical protein